MKKPDAKISPPSSARREPGGIAFEVSWCSLLVMVGLAPIALGQLAISDTTTLIGMWDATGLPKVIVIFVFLAVSLGSFCLWLVRVRRPVLWWHPALWLVLGMAGWACVSTLASVSPPLSVFGEYGRNEGVVAYVAYALVAFLAVQLIRSANQMRRVVQVAVAAGVIVAAYALIQYWGLDPLHWVASAFGERAASTFGNPDMLADYLVFPFALALGLALAEKRVHLRVAWWSSLGIITAGLVVTFTRGGWLGAGVALVIVGFVAWRSGWRPVRADLLAWAVVVALVAVLVFAAGTTIAGRLAPASTDAVRGASNGRTVIWSTAIEAWTKRPVFGWGPDTFARATRGTGSPRLFQMLGAVYADNAHDYPLELLVALGLPGLLLSLGALVWALVATRVRVLASKSDADQDGLIIAGWWAAVAGMIAALLFGVTQPGVIVWLWLAAGALLSVAADGVELTGTWKPTVFGSVGLVLALLVGGVALDWAAADFVAGLAVFSPKADTLVQIRLAEAINPLPQEYRLMQTRRLEAELDNMLRSNASASDIAPTVASLVDVYDRAVAHDPNDAETLLAAADILNGIERLRPGLGYTQQSLAFARRAADLGPNHWRTLAIYADALDESGDAAQAAEVRRRAQQLAPIGTQLSP